ncbi:MAG TPA: dihydrolipoyllysine-residue acetyltransferase [Gammaproteobacteria bacterium]|nr:dihydrolipoyllysine-residue acetyltransferase [Gammaproteobacteria bacterium]
MADTELIKVPDIGDFEQVDVIEVLVDAGQHVEQEQSLITLESDKATLEVPSPKSGTIRELRVKVGDQVSEGSPIATIEPDQEQQQPASGGASGDEAPAESAGSEAAPEEAARKPEAEAAASTSQEASTQQASPQREAAAPAPPANAGGGPLHEAPVTGWEHLDASRQNLAHASPSVRRFARELGVDLLEVKGSGRKGRILKEDVQAYVKASLRQGATRGGAIPPIPPVDFSKFGEIERRPLSRIKRKAAPNLHRSWLNLPHVTQFDEADVTDLESFRKGEKETAAAQDVHLTILAFLVKACAGALQAFPEVNSSLDPDGETLILKHYVHVGVAVDTDGGLLVPVIRDADAKGIYDIARELADLADRARRGKLSPSEMQGASFSISSLGGIGGTAFTPIINAPEVAILGVSRITTKPVWTDGEFQPRKMLPLSFSYDHRVIDGAQAARFTTHLAGLLRDLRRLLL